MSRKHTFKGQELVDLFNKIDQTENHSRHTTTEDRQDAVIRKEESLRANGQISPIQLQETGKDGVYFPITGLTRIAAAVRIVNGTEQTVESGEVDPDGVAKTVTTGFPADPKFSLDAIVFGVDELTPLEREVRSVVDNTSTEDPSDIDLAYSVERLRKDHKKTFVEIQGLLGISDPNKPGQLVRLLNLPGFVADAIHAGTIGTEFGLEFLKLSGAGRKAVSDALKAALAKGKGLTAKQLRTIAAAAEATAGDGEGGSGGDGGDGDGDEKPKNPPKLPINEAIEGVNTLIADLKSKTAAYQTDAAIARGTAAIDFVKKLKEFLTVKAGYVALSNAVDKAFNLD